MLFYLLISQDIRMSESGCNSDLIFLAKEFVKNVPYIRHLVSTTEAPNFLSGAPWRLNECSTFRGKERKHRYGNHYNNNNLYILYSNPLIKKLCHSV